MREDRKPGALILAAGLVITLSAAGVARGQSGTPPTSPLGASAPSAPPRDPSAPPRERDQEQHQRPADREAPALRISGFGDINFAHTKTVEGARGFSLGQFALHMASELSSRVTVFGELSFTARSDAGTGTPPATGFNAEIERLIVRFDHSDELKVSFGRYHTPINFWNTAYHHGYWLQTTIVRPEMIQFGGRFLPIHFVGGLVEGTLPAGGMNVSYKGGIGNGRGSVISRAGDAGDANGNRAWLVNGFAKPDTLYGLEFGGSAYGDRITLPNGREFAERIVAGHIVWNKEDPEIIAEFASVRHDEAGAAATWSRAFYVLGAYRLKGRAHQWKPYYRFEHIGIDDDDAVYETVLKLDNSTLGVRYDFSPFAAAKAEYRTWTRGAGSPRNHGAFFQLSFTF